MTEEQIALAKRAVACKGWRWMPGMLTDEGRRVMCVWPDDLGIKWSHIPENCIVRDADALPDLTDAATLGCLLALVREAWGDPTYLPTCLDAHDEAWVIESPKRERQTRYGSYASVLVAALEAAP